MLKEVNAVTRFENDGENSRMILTLDGTVPVIDFQIAMIRNNAIPGVLPLEQRRVDSKLLLYYDVTGKWRLKDLLDNKEFSGQEFITLLERFIGVITGSDAYLLDASQYVLDEEHIFVDSGMTPHLLYMPVKGQQDIHQRFKELLLQLIVYRARLSDQDSGPVLSGILNYLKREHFNIHAFQKALRDLNRSDSPCAPIPPVTPVTPKAVPQSLNDLIPQENKVKSPLVTPAQPTPAPAAKIKKQQKPQVSIVESEKITRRKYRASTVLAAFIFQGVLGAGVWLGYQPVYDATQDPATAWAALGLMVLCLDGLVLKRLFNPENRIEVQKVVKKRIPAVQQAAPVPEAPVNPQPHQAFPVNLDKQVISNVTVRGRAPLAYDTEVLSPAAALDSSAYDTVVLDAQDAVPYLVRKGPVQEIIRLDRTPLVIGRLPDLADHVVSDPTIGRMHAEVTWNTDQCHIRDLNSKNGTYVNGKRLAGPEPCSLEPGDEIRLGSLEYTLAVD